MSGEKTEAPSQRRLEKARADGRSPVSRDASMLAGLSAGLVVLATQADSTGVARWLTTALQQTRFEGSQTFSSAARALLTAAGPPAAAGLAAFAAVTLLQTGFLIHGAPLQPDVSRISPLSGIKRVLSPQTLVQLGKSLVKLGVMAACLYTAIGRLMPELLTMPGATPAAVLHHAATHARSLIFLMLGAQAVIAGADVAWERLRHMRQLRMSLQELRDEHKESEGNPQIKQRLRQLARSRRRRRMLLAVPKASVVITNPTHYAVALAYERGGQGAPRIVAKGPTRWPHGYASWRANIACRLWPIRLLHARCSGWTSIPRFRRSISRLWLRLLRLSGGFGRGRGGCERRKGLLF